MGLWSDRKTLHALSEQYWVKPEPRVMEWMEATDEGMLYLSVLTLGEIRKDLAS